MFRKLPIAVKASAFLLIATFMFTIGSPHRQAAFAAAPSTLTIAGTAPTGCAAATITWTLAGVNPIDATAITFAVTSSGGTFSPNPVAVASVAATTTSNTVTFTPTSTGVSGTVVVTATALSGVTTITSNSITLALSCAPTCTTTTTAACNCSSLVLGQCGCDNVTILCSNCGTLYTTSAACNNCYGALAYSSCSACGLSSTYYAGCSSNCGSSLYGGSLYGSSLYGGYGGYGSNNCNPCGASYYNACVPPVPCNFVGCGTACYSYNTGCTNICTTTYCNSTCGTQYPGYNNSYYGNSLCAGPPANLSVSVPASVNCGSQTDVTASVTDVSGGRVADGTPVSFSTNLGYVTGSANTSGGSAVSSLQIAPRMSGVATVTVMVGNVTRTAAVTINCNPAPSLQGQPPFGPGQIQQAIQQFAPQVPQLFRPPNTGDGGLLGHVVSPMTTDESCD